MSFRFAGAVVGALLAVSAIALPAAAHELKVGSLELTNLWARATPPAAAAGGGFLTITNTGSEDDTLIAMSTPVSAKGELHMMEVKDGVMKMREVEGGIALPAGKTVTLAPGGLHLMFIGLKEPLKDGGKVPVTLTFAKAGTVETFLHIMPIGSQGPSAAADGMKMDMKTMDHGNMSTTK